MNSFTRARRNFALVSFAAVVSVRRSVVEQGRSISKIKHIAELKSGILAMISPASLAPYVLNVTPRKAAGTIGNVESNAVRFAANSLSRANTGRINHNITQGRPLRPPFAFSKIPAGEEPNRNKLLTYLLLFHIVNNQRRPEVP